MRIAINAFYLGQPAQGFGRYTHNLLAAIREWDDPQRFTLLVPDDCTKETLEEWTDFPRRLLPSLPRLEWAFDLTGNADLNSHELLYVPYNTPPLLPPPCPLVVTIHDTIPALPLSRHALRHPRLLSLFNLEELRLMQRELRAAQAAACITTVSEHARRDILRRLRFPAEKLLVVPNTLDPCFRPQPAPEVARVRRRYQTGQDYLFYLGGIRRRKNIDGLLRTYALLPQRLRERYRLVVAGHLGEHGPLRRLLQGLGLQGQIRETGPLPEQDVPALYSGARLFLFLSLYEGFGLPPVEAAACGTPSLVADSASLPEVCAGFAACVSPYRPNTAARRLTHLLEDDSALQQLAQGCGAVRERFSRRVFMQKLNAAFSLALQ